MRSPFVPSTSSSARPKQGTTIVSRCWIHVPILNSYRPRLTARPFHTSVALKTSRDRSTIDFAYFPKESLDAPQTISVMRVPILPNNYSERDLSHHHEPMVEPVIRPEISTVSANGTHIDNPSAMSDVVDNHAADIDHFDLTKHVANAASKVADAGAEQIENKGGSMRSLWEGLMDDIFGERKVTHA